MQMLHRLLGPAGRAIACGLVLALGLPPSALAAAPPSAPQQVFATGFEEGSFPPVGLQLTPAPGFPVSRAYWDRNTSIKRSGGYGLWCSGSNVASWPVYPEGTRGYADVDLTALQDYYSASLDYYYTMPSLGVSDDNSFIGMWYVYGDGYPVDSRTYAKTAVGVWSAVSSNLTAVTNTINLSRTRGSLRFKFIDTYEYSGDYPKTGIGASIDDLVVAGYKYGPVRTLSAEQSGTSIQLTWAKPYRSTGETSLEERDVSYRVWRSPKDQNDWTELTSSRISATSFLDGTAAENTWYDYQVQAWDTGTGTGYGELAGKVSGKVATAPSIAAEIEADDTDVPYDTTVTFTYRITNDGAQPLTSVQVDTGDLFGVIAKGGGLAIGETWTVVRSKALTADVSATAVGSGVYDSTTYTGTATPVSVAVGDPPPPPTRVSGDTRFETAVKVSQEAFPDAASLGDGKAVVIASAYGWADALPASSLAGAVGGPLLLVAKDDVPKAVANEIKRLKGLGVTKSYVVGGDPVVGSGARAELKSLLGSTPIRVEGSDRYGTSYAVSEKTRSLRASGATGGTAFVATGLNFPDALAASSIAAATTGPIVLTSTNSLPSSTLKALSNLKPSKIVVCGGPSAVGSAVESKLKSLYPGKVVRKAGANRYDTAKALITYGKTLTGVSAPSGIFLATGTNYPDALSGGVLAGIGTGDWKPLMLTDPKKLSPQAVSFINANPSLNFACVLGGPSAVADSVRVQAVSLID